MRYIPPDLQTHLDGSGTTLAWLLKVIAKDGTVITTTSLDVDLVYDDGAGAYTYKADLGLDQSAVDASGALNVDNSEANILFGAGSDFTEQQIEAGVLDYADFWLYRVNWQDLSQGHYLVQSGTSGRVRAVDGLTGVVELRALSQQLKQIFVEVYSLTCRADFGSGGGGTSCGLRRGQCGFDAASLWQSHSVTAVGVETDRLFTMNSAPAVSGPNGALSFVPGLVEWLTGDNTGHFSEVELLDGADTTLRFGTPYGIQIGDTFRVRPDCDKKKETCLDDFDNLLNFRGEAEIPLTEQNLTTPGARYPTYPGWVDFAGTVGTVPDDPPDESIPPPPTSGSFAMPQADFRATNAYGLGSSVSDASIGRMYLTGLKAGMTVVITGSTLNDGTYEVKAIGSYSFRTVETLTDEDDANINVSFS